MGAGAVGALLQRPPQPQPPIPWPKLRGETPATRYRPVRDWRRRAFVVGPHWSCPATHFAHLLTQLTSSPARGLSKVITDVGSGFDLALRGTNGCASNTAERSGRKTCMGFVLSSMKLYEDVTCRPTRLGRGSRTRSRSDSWPRDYPSGTSRRSFRRPAECARAFPF